MSEPAADFSAVDHQRLAELAEQLRENTIADAEVAELESLLADSAAAREAFAGLAMLTADLRQAQGRFPCPVPAVARARIGRRSFFHRWIPLAVAAGLTVATILAGRRFAALPASRGALVATVSNASGAVLFAEGRPLSATVGHALGGGTLQLRSGLLELTYASGVVIVLEAPARFELRHAGLLWLAEGNVSARVPDAAKGFAVETPSARIVDLGTEFGVSAAAGSSEVHVFKGEVLVTNASEPDSLRLSETRATRIDTKTRTPTGIGYEPQRFVRTFDERASDFARLVRSLDPVAYYRMRITPEADRLVDVSESGLDGHIHPGSGAGTSVPGRVGAGLRLGGAEARSYAVVPAFPAAPEGTLTVCAWVRAASRSRWASIAKHWAKDRGRSQGGQFHFGLWHDEGSLEVHVHDAAEREVGVRDAVPLPIGEWQLVAFTLDGATLRLYRNGREVASAACDGLSPNAPDALGIGVKLDGGLVPERNTPGFWDGVIDELAIFHRALTPAQLLALYESAP
ncbi:MAG: LamG-like jellyroll fold domain-containing protein [Opitutaceae bacterium]